PVLIRLAHVDDDCGRDAGKLVYRDLVHVHASFTTDGGSGGYGCLHRLAGTHPPEVAAFELDDRDPRSTQCLAGDDVAGTALTLGDDRPNRSKLIAVPQHPPGAAPGRTGDMPVGVLARLSDVENERVLEVRHRLR